MVLNPQTVDLMHAAADAKFERKTPSEELKPKPSIPLRPPNLKLKSESNNEAGKRVRDEKKKKKKKRVRDRFNEIPFQRNDKKQTCLCKNPASLWNSNLLVYLIYL